MVTRAGSLSVLLLIALVLSVLLVRTILRHDFSPWALAFLVLRDGAREEDVGKAVENMASTAERNEVKDGELEKEDAEEERRLLLKKRSLRRSVVTKLKIIIVPLGSVKIILCSTLHLPGSN